MRTRVLALSFLLFAAGCSHVVALRGPADVSKHDGGSGPSGFSASGWVELGPGGQAIARVLAGAQGDCPAVKADGTVLPTTLRADATSDGRFPHKVCEATLPTGTRSAALADGTTFSLASEPARVVVLGDTGCRLKAGKSGKVQAQDCNDPSQGWPFAEVASAAASLKPDLVIHLGDYHYREAACPPNDAGCSGSVPGDVWDSWNEDFFAPAQPLLAAAPWIFVRGNHEICARAQEGFFRLLDPRPLAASCPDTSAPYLVPLTGLTLAVFDSSFEDPTAASVAPLRSLGLKGAWLVTHRPLWLSDEEAQSGDGDNDADEVGKKPEAPIGPLQGAALVLAGHRHLLRVMTFADGRSPQVIAGNGGTLLEAHPATYVPGTPVDVGSTQVATTGGLVDFGFLFFERKNSGGWAVKIYDRKGGGAGTCDVTNGKNGGAASLKCQLNGGGGKSQGPGAWGAPGP